LLWGKNGKIYKPFSPPLKKYNLRVKPNNNRKYAPILIL